MNVSSLKLELVKYNKLKSEINLVITKINNMESNTTKTISSFETSFLINDVSADNGIINKNYILLTDLKNKLQNQVLPSISTEIIKVTKLIEEAIISESIY